MLNTFNLLFLACGLYNLFPLCDHLYKPSFMVPVCKCVGKYRIEVTVPIRIRGW